MPFSSLVGLIFNPNFPSLNIIELVRCAWDVRRYAENIPIASSVREEHLLSYRFPPVYEHSHLEDDPRVVLDRQGDIFLWYLPGVLTPSRKVSFVCNLGYR